jgi:hypothetical protein
VANTLAYYDTATITAVKSFIVQAPVGPHFNAAVITKRANLKLKILPNNFRFLPLDNSVNESWEAE